ncbi:transcription elongation factor GreA [Spiroplasma endosymbiont of Virgichneumon dumeticola]|uniref:transcription elongation factor GreA n=1 Tax=Spiroplasma endosymbiont of Virgichneumon dumeticola TaxID=3139323 RepID=UPI0035C93A16
MSEINKNKQVIVTEQGLEKIKAELKKIVEVERESIKERLKAARADGDLSENADYTSAREEQAKNEARIQELEAIINNAVILEEQQNRKNTNVKAVRVGSWVTIAKSKDGKPVDGTQQKFKIVGSIESNPFEGWISNECPLAISIMNATTGETVDVKGIKESYKVIILQVENQG